jgi:glycogen debranching enzyme
MRSQSVSILDGSTFVVSDLRGDVDASPTEPQGLFHRDTRFLSRWKLTADGHELDVLSTDDLHYFATQFFLVPGTGSIYTNATWAVVRKRAVGDGFREELAVHNYGPEPLGLRLRIDAAADFADLFEVKDAQIKKGEPYQRVEDGRLILGYRRDTFVRETWISSDAAETRLDPSGIAFDLTVPPHGVWSTGLEVVTARDGDAEPKTHPKYAHVDDAARPHVGVGLDELLAMLPRVVSSWDDLGRTYRRSLIDLAALRFYPRILPGKAIPAAGLPWFMTLFGRDSIITSFQALPFVHELAETTLRVLAARQARRDDAFRDEEPGKILHEQRFGELTAFEERPHSPYYGAADTTPLFLVLLDEYERWTGDRDLVRELEPVARRALAWIDAFGDRDGDGYVEYERRNPDTGLENQCWKDSWNSILFADGSLAKLPRATCEIQGYVYDAKVRCARLARRYWGDPMLAERLEHEAAELKRRFNQDFWLADRGYYALALDGDKRPADSLTSNIGHLLWSGIVEHDRAGAVVGHLLGPRLFTGWGVRTMAEGDAGFNPIGYHNGTVWPHDSSLIALGLNRYGFRQEASRIALGILEAATYFDGRLPEAFAGYRREETGFPVEYPTACSPQAWATGAPLLMLRVLLGLEPDGRRLGWDPVLPERVGRLEVYGLPWQGGSVDVVPGAPPGSGTAVGPTGTPATDGEPSAATSAQAFFDALAIVDASDLLGVESSCRFDVTDVGSWLVVISDGRLGIGEGEADAETVVALSEETLLRLARGEQNSYTALMSGKVTVRGQLALAERLLRSIF